MRLKWCLAVVFVLISGCIYLGMTSGRAGNAREMFGESPDIRTEKDEGASHKSVSADGQESDSASVPETGSGNVTAYIRVHVCGAVNSPGVYEISEGERLVDAVSAAGGFLEEAAQDYCNLAAVLQDGEKVYIPTGNEVRQLLENQGMVNEAQLAQQQKTSGGEAAGTKININTATVQQLMTLNGIGQAKAEAIVAYREANGGFQVCEDLMKVSGIKESLYRKICDDIVAGQ